MRRVVVWSAELRGTARAGTRRLSLPWNAQVYEGSHHAWPYPCRRASAVALICAAPSVMLDDRHGFQLPFQVDGAYWKRP